MFRFETEARDNGYTAIAGVDEVGRGPIAGPVVAAAVILPTLDEASVPGVNDSKTLSARRREELAIELRNLPGIRIGLGVVEAPEIDRLNILQATYAAMRTALEQLSPPPDFALVDGNPVPDLPVPSTSIVRGDGRSASIAAASIIAKVTRDRVMSDYDKIYEGYQFSEHKGYGTRRHLEALRSLGPTEIHRRSFAPVSRIINGGYYQPELEIQPQ